MTLKVPFANGEMGNAIFAVPLKHYTNNRGFTSNWGVTPSVRLPTSTTAGSGNDTKFGLSVSYSAETTTFHQIKQNFITAL